MRTEVIGGGGIEMPDDQFDVSLEDSVLLAEVELMTDLIVAATSSDAPMSPQEIDEVLGLAIPSPRPAD